MSKTLASKRAAFVASLLAAAVACGLTPLAFAQDSKENLAQNSASDEVSSASSDESEAKPQSSPTSSETAQQLVAFEKTTAKRLGEAFEVRLSTADLIEAKAVSASFINETVQIDVPQSSFPKGKQLIRTADATIKSVYIYEPDDQTARIRIVLTKGIAARSFDGAVQIARGGGALSIRLVGKGNRRPHRRGETEVARTLDIVDADTLAASNSLTAPDAPARLVVGPKPETKADPKPSAAPGPQMAPGAFATTPESAIAIARASSLSVAPLNGAGSDSALLDGKKEADLKFGSKVAESEIPVSIGDQKNKKTESDPLRRALIAAFALAVALGAGAYALKKAANRTAGAKRSPKIQVLGQHYLGPKKSLLIVQVAGESLLLGVTENNIGLIKALALIDDEVPATLPNNFDGALDDFAEESGVAEEYSLGRFAGALSGFAGLGGKSESRLAAPEPSASRRVETRVSKAGSPEDYDSFAMRGLSEIRDVVSGQLSNRVKGTSARKIR